jgi:hypothetical protein
MTPMEGSWVYPFSSPTLAEYFELKLLKLKDKEVIKVVNGTYH